MLCVAWPADSVLSSTIAPRTSERNTPMSGIEITTWTPLIAFLCLCAAAVAAGYLSR